MHFNRKYSRRRERSANKVRVKCDLSFKNCIIAVSFCYFFKLLSDNQHFMLLRNFRNLMDRPCCIEIKRFVGVWKYTFIVFCLVMLGSSAHSQTKKNKTMEVNRVDKPLLLWPKGAPTEKGDIGEEKMRGCSAACPE